VTLGYDYRRFRRYANTLGLFGGVYLLCQEMEDRYDTILKNHLGNGTLKNHFEDSLKHLYSLFEEVFKEMVL